MQNIFDNKPKFTPEYNLRIDLESGCMVNFDTWVPGNKFDIPFKDIEFSIWYDEHELLKDYHLTNSISINHWVEDSKIVNHHTLKFSMFGKHNGHSITVDNQDVVAMIKATIYIEDLPVNYFLDWSEYIGENGEKLLAINTPIYPWLFEKEQEILQEYSFKLRGHFLPDVE